MKTSPTTYLECGAPRRFGRTGLAPTQTSPVTTPSGKVHALTHRTTKQAAFTLVELVGTLFIIAVILFISTDAIVKRVRLAQQQADSAELATLRKGLVEAIIRNKAIPSTTNWISVLGTSMAVSPTQISQSRVGNPRLFLTDPQLKVGPGQGHVLPYTQGAYGSIRPNHARVLLVSSTGPALPQANQINFTNLWDHTGRQLPPNWSAIWPGGDPDDLHIERIDLQQSFHRIVLNNLEKLSSAKYALETTNNMGTVPIGSNLELWILDGTAINFYEADNTFQAREFIHEPASYVFENLRWGRSIVQGRNNVEGDFGLLIDQFLATPAPPPHQSQFGANQQAIVDVFYIYLRTYGIWATDGFPTGGSASGQQVPDFRILDAAQTHIDAFSYNITK